MRFFSLAAAALATFILAPSSLTHAEKFDSEKYLTVKKMTIQEVEASWDEGFLKEDLPRPATDLDGVEIILDQVINIGRKVWAVVEANRPVVSVKDQVATALPRGLSAWEDLQGWQTPISKVYRVVYENLYGVDVVDFTFRVIYTYGGNLRGKGRYLTQVTIVPAHLDVAWGYTFDAETTVPSVVNVGTHADPVAGMELRFKWSVDTAVQYSESSISYFVRGDGGFAQLGR